MFGHGHRLVSFTDVDYQPCYGDATQEGTVTTPSKRRAVNNDHGYYAVPVEMPVDLLTSRDHRQLAVRHAKRSVKRAVRRMVSYYLQKEHHYYGVAFGMLLSHCHRRWLPYICTIVSNSI